MFRLNHSNPMICKIRMLHEGLPRHVAGDAVLLGNWARTSQRSLSCMAGTALLIIVFSGGGQVFVRIMAGRAFELPIALIVTTAQNQPRRGKTDGFLILQHLRKICCGLMMTTPAEPDLL